jgi:hypothetical protein
MHRPFGLIKRCFTRVLAWLSLAACVTIAGLWVRSYFATDYVSPASYRLHQAASCRDGVLLDSVGLVRREGARTTTLPSSGDVISEYTDTPDSYVELHPGAPRKVRGTTWTSYPPDDRRHLINGTVPRGRSRFWPAYSPVSRVIGHIVIDSVREIDGEARQQWLPGEIREVGGTLWIPYWLPLLATAAMPLLRLRTWSRRRKDLRIGHCRNCGYDLRATPGRCPECGAVPARPA